MKPTRTLYSALVGIGLMTGLSASAQTGRLQVIRNSADAAAAVVDA